MKKYFLFAVLLMTSLKLAAFAPNPRPPRLNTADYEVLMHLESHGRSGIVWKDGIGRTHVASLPGYLNFCSMITGVVYVYPCCCCSGGCEILFTKDEEENIYLNGVRVHVYPLDYSGMHYYLLPA